MRNIQIIIEYDGTNYCGWQIQDNGISVQEKIIKAVEQVTKHQANIIGSGRTDTGVHALGQSANFKTSTKIPVDRIPLALNTKLPKDIRIIKAYERDLEFHSRYSAKQKIYKYKIINNLVGSALAWNQLHHIKESLDIDKMQRACTYFVGTHDFTSFSSIHSAAQSKTRTIYHCSIEKQDDIIDFNIDGNGFLYNMVRIIMGTLIEIGKGKIEPDSIPKILKGKDRNLAGPTAPGHGLYLKKVIY